jgi:tRNA U34 2-thiouridine synthase MnmA/TrmU
MSLIVPSKIEKKLREEAEKKGISEEEADESQELCVSTKDTFRTRISDILCYPLTFSTAKAGRFPVCQP